MGDIESGNSTILKGLYPGHIRRIDPAGSGIIHPAGIGCSRTGRREKRLVAKQGTIKRGRRYTGYPGALPGALALLLLIFLPGFICIVSSVSGFGSLPSPPSGAEAEGSLAVPRAIAAGLMGGLIACLLGVAAAYALMGWRYKLPVFILLCIPAAIGESAAASAFGSTLGPLIEGVAPLNGLISFTLFESWRLIGPVAVAATVRMEHMGRSHAIDALPAAQVLLASWMRWRVFLGACLLGGIIVAITGAGHMPIGGDAVVRIVGPAEPGWRDPTLQAAVAWAALTWPLYIIAVALFLSSITRLAARAGE